MTRAGRWVLAAAIAGSALAVGTVHTVTLCIVTGVLVAAAWWGAEPMKARSAATAAAVHGDRIDGVHGASVRAVPIGWRTWCGGCAGCTV